MGHCIDFPVQFQCGTLYGMFPVQFLFAVNLFLMSVVNVPWWPSGGRVVAEWWPSEGALVAELFRPW